jgi:hypothetical protein
MKRNNVRQRDSKHPRAKVNPSHGLIGVWEQEPNAFGTTTVVYRIAVKGRAIVISGVDESDKTALRISDIRWNGKQLRFVSLYPPTKHKALHLFRLTARGRAEHTTTYTDDEGTWTCKERWNKRNPSGS